MCCWLSLSVQEPRTFVKLYASHWRYVLKNLILPLNRISMETVICTKLIIQWKQWYVLTIWYSLWRKGFFCVKQELSRAKSFLNVEHKGFWGCFLLSAVYSQPLLLNVLKCGVMVHCKSVGVPHLQNLLSWPSSSLLYLSSKTSRKCVPSKVKWRMRSLCSFLLRKANSLLEEIRMRRPKNHWHRLLPYSWFMVKLAPYTARNRLTALSFLLSTQRISGRRQHSKSWRVSF